MSSNTYATIQEYMEKDMEAILYFVKYQGNERRLQKLKDTFENIEWVVVDDQSTFDIDLDHLVSNDTAKQVTKLELNSNWHRKFDGKLKSINFRIKSDDDEEEKIKKVTDIIGGGKIADYLSEEDIDEEDLEEDDLDGSTVSGSGSDNESED